MLKEEPKIEIFEFFKIKQIFVVAHIVDKQTSKIQGKRHIDVSVVKCKGGTEESRPLTEHQIGLDDGQAS